MSNAASNTQTSQRFSGKWETKQLKELGEFAKGRGIKRDDVSDEGLPCVRYGELYTRYQDYILEVASRIPPSVAATALPIKTGDLLFAGSGETAEEIGRCAAYLGEEQAYAGGDVIVLTPSGQNSIYLGHLMNSPIVSAQKARLGQGDAVVHIYINNLAQVQVELPPITEQNAIAGVLSDVDGLLNALDALIAKKQVIKRATMQQLLTGKTRLPGFSGAWETKRLGEIAPIRNHKTLPAYVNPDTLCVELDHIEQGSGQLLEYAIAQNSTSSKYHFCAGDVLFGRLRPYLRKFWHADRDGICTTEIWPLMVSTDQIDSGFLYATVQSEPFIAAASISYGTHMPRADWNVMQNFEICLPAIREQRAIASVFSDMDAEITALKQRRDKTRAIKQGMMQQLLTGKVRLVK